MDIGVPIRSFGQVDAQPLIDAALTFSRDAIASGDRSYGPPLENAALAVLRGERVTALDELEHAERAGWRDGVIMRRDPLLAPLAADVRFAQTVQRIERDVQEMRERIDLHDIDSVVSRLAGAAASSTTR